MKLLTVNPRGNSGVYMHSSRGKELRVLAWREEKVGEWGCRGGRSPMTVAAKKKNLAAPSTLHAFGIFSYYGEPCVSLEGSWPMLLLIARPELLPRSVLHTIAANVRWHVDYYHSRYLYSPSLNPYQFTEP